LFKHVPKALFFDLNYQKEFTTANNKLSKHKIKKESFWNMLEQTEPDIIIASETWQVGVTAYPDG
jgi:hypothetical protein